MSVEEQLDLALGYIKHLIKNEETNEMLKRLKLRGIRSKEDDLILEQTLSAYLTDHPHIEDYGFAAHAISFVRYAYEYNWDLEDSEIIQIHLNNRQLEIDLALRYADFLNNHPTYWKIIKKGWRRYIAEKRVGVDIYTDKELKAINAIQVDFCNQDKIAPESQSILMAKNKSIDHFMKENAINNLFDLKIYKELSESLLLSERAVSPDYYFDEERFKDLKGMYSWKR